MMYEKSESETSPDFLLLFERLKGLGQLGKRDDQDMERRMARMRVRRVAAMRVGSVEYSCSSRRCRKLCSLSRKVLSVEEG